MRASGVYWELTDSSVKTPGSSGMVGVVAMMTTKGSTTALNTVTADNCEDVIGYNLGYNGDYLGLSRILNVVPSIQVMRLNHGATVANIYDSSNAVASYAGLHEGESLEELATTFAVQMKTPGNPGDYYVKILPVASSQSVNVPEPVSGSYTFALANELDLTRRPVNYNGVLYALAIYNETREVLVGLAGTDGKVYSVVDGEITETQIGTATRNSLTLDATAYTPTGSFIEVDGFVLSTKYYKLYHATSDDGVNFSQKAVYEFSLNSENSLYYEGVDFVDFTLLVKNTTSFKYSLVENYTLLQNGTNGTLPSAHQLDFTALSKSGANVCLLMNILDVDFINAFAQKCESLFVTLLHSTPPYKKYAEVANWGKTLYATNFRQGYWIPEVVETEVGTIYIAPSVNAYILYAQMNSSLGSMNYPAAGYSYGRINVNTLLETDYALYRDQLKTNKINYQMIGPQGPVMWEQRTGYAKESDLTYANTTFILRDLRERLIDYGYNYNFVYTTPRMLNAFTQGIRTILQDMKDEGFIAKFSLHVPSFEEAQAAGRTLTVSVGVAITQDSEEIVFKVNLGNYDDLEG